MRRPGNLLLAVWMLVAATATVVTHRHAAAAGGHGFGWVALPGRAGADSGLHHHLILGGIESGGIAGAADPGPDPGLTPTAAADPDAAAAPADHVPLATAITCAPTVASAPRLPRPFAPGRSPVLRC